jgi:hypothetical protein
VSLLAQSPSRQVVYLPYEQAEPILSALAEELPAALKQPDASVWSQWAARRDEEIRSRLVRGEEDTLVNFLFFGTSFTSAPRLNPQQMEGLATPANPAIADPPPAGKPGGVAKLLDRRLDDLVAALATPGKNERLLFARKFVEGRGYTVTPASRAHLREYLLETVRRVSAEQAAYAAKLQEARSLGSATEEFIQRSTLYQARGLSLDTSLMPNFALEESLKALQAQGLLATPGIRRVAIIGPGLDFTDKQAGYDFYPQQTVQPFAILDTLLRLGLANPDKLEVFTFDISPRVNDHLRRAQARARQGHGYVLQLPHDRRQWTPGAVRYWQQFGDRIGIPVEPLPVPPGIGEVEIRAVRVRPSMVTRLAPLDLNIVLQQLDLPAEERYDLIIATNVLVYYDVLEQSLAVANVERMLRPGGFLLTNNALLELPASRLRSVDYLTVVYSDRADDGDQIVWYQRLPD